MMVYGLMSIAPSPRSCPFVTIQKFIQIEETFCGRTDVRTGGRTFPPSILLGRLSEVDLKKVKEVDLYSAFVVVPHTQGAQVRITQRYLQITLYLPLPRKHSPDGASPD